MSAEPSVFRLPSGWPHIDERQARRLLILIALGALALGALAYGLSLPRVAKAIWGLGTLPVLVGLAVSIVRDLLAGRMGVDAIALVSMTAALLLGEPLAAVVVAVMYAGGNVLEDFAVQRAERSLKALVDRAPRIAHRQEGDSLADVGVDAVAIGDRLVVRAGEIVPVDGVLAGAAHLDESALTGEPIPVMRSAGETALSGAVNAGETFTMVAAARAGESTYAGIVRLVTAAQTAKAPFIRMADRFAILLLPVTLAVAAAAYFVSGDPIRGLAVLVAATPCPLILAAPVAFIAGVSQAARRGILVKGGGVLESLARTQTVMFDKTGTLTVGGARVVAIETAPDKMPPDEVLRLCASLEQASHHVVAAAIVAHARDKGLALALPENVRETLGSGLEGVVDGRKVRVGAAQLVLGSRARAAWSERVLRRASWRSALSVFVSVDGEPAGAILLADELRRNAPRAVLALRESGVRRIVMLTGDRADAAETIGAALDLDAVLADRVPSDKVDAVATEQRLAPTIMVGDGINDAPALAAADVGIAMGARGATAASEAADAVILVEGIDRVPEAIVIARRARRIALQSIVIGLALSGAAMIAAAFGYLSPVVAAIGQEAIDVAVILNALRALVPGWQRGGRPMTVAAATALSDEHRAMEKALDRLRAIADALDDVPPAGAVALIREAHGLVAEHIVEHERNDEAAVYPGLRSRLTDSHGLAAMSRAHREIQHLARLIGRIETGLDATEADRYLVRDAQRVIEAIEALVRLHNAQEEDIYEHASRA